MNPLKFDALSGAAQQESGWGRMSRESFPSCGRWELTYLFLGVCTCVLSHVKAPLFLHPGAGISLFLYPVESCEYKQCSNCVPLAVFSLYYQFGLKGSKSLFSLWERKYLIYINCSRVDSLFQLGELPTSLWHRQRFLNPPSVFAGIPSRVLP